MILDEIVIKTKQRVESAKRKIPFEAMKEKALSVNQGSLSRKYTKDRSLESVLQKEGIRFICEIKKASPSKGLLSPEFPYVQIAKEYIEAGADAMSVLTEPDFFKGSNDYLQEGSLFSSIPILRKDFTVDEYQIYEAKTIGADAVLLIGSLLDTDTLKYYLGICDKLGLSALVEAHNEKEIHSAVRAGARIIGVNNRDLKTFTVDIGNSIRLRRHVPKDILFVAESGIHTREDIRRLEEAGVDAVLIGEAFMKSEDKRHTLNQLRMENSLS